MKQYIPHPRQRSESAPGRWLHVGANPRGREVSVVLPFQVYERCYHGEWFDVVWDGSVWSPNPLEDRYASSVH